MQDSDHERHPFTAMTELMGLFRTRPNCVLSRVEHAIAFELPHIMRSEFLIQIPGIELVDARSNNTYQRRSHTMATRGRQSVHDRHKLVPRLNTKPMIGQYTDSELGESYLSRQFPKKFGHKFGRETRPRSG
ncbi:MAG: hypothetical protein OXC68_03730 [Aestuariivita sp.]|nr:hypothetical protein [Aestuariivita sp.]